MAKRSKKAPVAETPKVPHDGKEAFLAGFTAADCPFPEESEYDDFEQWNADWDAAADEASEKENEVEGELDAGPEYAEGTEDRPDSSVVKGTYRARYAEAGHPTHCGDELANLLNNLCLTKAGIDMPRFEHICAANGVDLSKYNRTTRGWQGRLRMTGRNMLAAKVAANGGAVKTTYATYEKDAEGNEHATGLHTLEGAEAEYRLSAEWLASRKLGKKVG
jgi:hypothetical protein